MRHRAVVALAALLFVTGTSADSQSLRDIEGVWNLVEWHYDGEILTAPEVGGLSRG